MLKFKNLFIICYIHLKNLWKSHSYYLRHSQVQDNVLLKNIPEIDNWKQEFSQVGGCDECDVKTWEFTDGS